MKPDSALALLLLAGLSANWQAPFARCDEGPVVTVDSREALQQALARAKPGTMIRIAPGTYRGGLSFSGVRGTKDRPIVIAGLDSEKPPVFKGGGSGFHFRDPQYLELRHLIITGISGNGLNIDDGGTPETPAKHVVLRGLEIRDIGPNGNRDGIKLSGVDHFLIENCTVERWGDNGSAIDMVGCHHGEIKNSTFRYRSDLAANGVQTKGGSSDIAVRRCRFENAGSRAVNLGGNTGRDFFRPENVTYEAKDITVEDSTFIGSMSPVAFVGIDGAVVRHNTIYRPTRWIMRILQENQAPDFVRCRNGRFANNLVVFRSDEVRATVNIGGGTLPETFQFAGNHWYCLDKPEQSQRLSLPVDEAQGTYGTAPEFINEKDLDLRLKKTSPVRNAGVRKRAAEP